MTFEQENKNQRNLEDNPSLEDSGDVDTSDLGFKYECLGHNYKFKGDCYKCKTDGFNKNCSSYKFWRTIVAFYVVSEDIENE